MATIDIGIRIQRFWTHFSPDRTGELRGVDMVAYGPRGETDKNLNICTVSSLSKLAPRAEDNMASVMAHARWDYIKPLYDAWKTGQELPEHGTPLAAWNAITAEEAEALKAHGIRTVEDVRDLVDAEMAKIPVPSMRSKRDLAAAFLKSADKSKAAAELARVSGENDALKGQIAELTKMVEQLMDADPPKRRGRPPKAEAEPETQNEVEEAA